MKNSMIGRQFVMAAAMLVCGASAHAAVVSIDDMFVDRAVVKISVLGRTGTLLNTTLSPSAMIDMGTYQDPIISFSQGATSLKFYTTNAYGMPAPTGQVDTTAGTIGVDLSSLRLALTTNTKSYDIAAWPFNTPADKSIYDPLTHRFALAWIETIANRPGPLDDITIGFLMSGTVSLAQPVPLPAALWLLGSGLLGLFGIARRKR